MRETSLDGLSDAELRARYDDDGYVLLRGVLPAFGVRKIRDAYLDKFAAAHKTLDPFPQHGLKGHPAYEFVRTAQFRAFVEQPVFQALAERLTGAAVAPIRRTPLRHFPAGSKVASRAHIDGTYIDGNATDVITVWTPLGDCTVQGGSLMYLEGSHATDVPERVRGRAPMDRTNDVRPITHDLKWMAETANSRWLVADFAAGDVVVHSPRIVHATLDAMAGERVSADVRFRRLDSPRDPRWDNDWSSDDGY